MTSAEQLIETDLQELLGGITPPDLIELTLARLEAGDETGAQPTGEAAPAAVAILATRGRMLLLRRLAVAACILLALTLITWVLWPRPLPASVTATPAASYLVRDDYIQLKSGWLLLTDGAPEVRADNGRVSDVRGRAVAGVGIPNAETLDALAMELQLSDSETQMLKLTKRWLTAGSLAVCVLTGQAMLNDALVQADELPAPEVKNEIPKPDDIAGVKKLLENVQSLELRALRDDWQYSGWLALESADAAELGTTFAKAISARPREIAGWDHNNELLFTLTDGSVVKAAVYESGGLLDLKLPGWQRWEQYTCTKGLYETIKPRVEEAKKLERYPVRDLPAMRRSMCKAAKVRFVDKFEQTEEFRGEFSDPALVAKLAGLVWHDDMSFSKSHVGDYEAYELTFEMDNGEQIRVNMQNTGIMAVYNGGKLLRTNDIAPDESVREIHALLKPLVAKSGFRVLRQWNGADSSITQAGVRVVTDDEGWVKLWAEHTAPELMEAPVMDFENEVVLAIFGGTSANSLGYFAEVPLMGEREYVLRVDEKTYQTMGRGDTVTPYGIFVLTRTDRPVYVEENVQSLIGRPPIWKRHTPAYQPLITPRYPLEGSWTVQRQWQGSDSLIEQRELHVIRDAQSFDKLWQRHSGTDAPSPKVEFDKFVVVAVFGGRQKGERGKILDYRVQACFVNGGGVLRFAGQEYRSEVEHTPYGIWVLPKLADVKLEEREYPLMPEGVEIDYDHLPYWLERELTK
ncbi:MAG: hypothetical protein H6841_07720 [Planctomycetes bacterium]|nr:hypothetical protein [Planctomycetota bacterium]MCB9935246.1 hypothetical protein [Planctomycetota bacterium]